MLTYGKRKKPSLPSFSSIRDSSASSRSKIYGSKKRGTSIVGPVISNHIAFNHDDSIDEMAKMLLDDTTAVSDPAQRLAVQCDAQQDKDLPQLPPDDAWAETTEHVVAAAGEMSGLFKFVERSTPPPIPRRSSKRKSIRPNTFTALTAEEGDSQATMVNTKVKAMMEATNTLKGNGKGKNSGPFIPIKKRRLQDNKVLVKVRAAINEHLNSRSFKKRHDPIRDDYLLDNLNEAQDHDEDLSQYVSAMDIRLNEGDNLKNPKVASLTGHGYVLRKPVADDGRSIRSRKSNTTDPFSERPGSSGITRTPTNFELSVRDDLSIDRSEEIIPELPTIRSQSSRDSLVRGKKSKGSRLAFDIESVDALFSSSPLAQSTPRIRLEPTMEGDGRKLLRHVPADCRSLFDADASSMIISDMEIDSMLAKSQTDKIPSDRVTRKTSIRDVGLFKSYSKKTKKHPSPSKAELEVLEKSLKESPEFGSTDTFIVSERCMVQSAAPNNYDTLSQSTQALAPKDLNAKVKDPAHSMGKRNGFGLFPKPTMQPNLSRSGISMPDMTKRKGQRTMIPRPADTNRRPRPELEEPRYSLRKADLNVNDMDVDELQWNNSVYNIGR